MTDYQYNQLERFLANIPHKTPYTHKLNELTDISVVQIKSLTDISQQAKHEITRRYQEKGFAVFEFLKESPTDKNLIRLSEQLQLGLPFVPPHYKKNLSTYEPSGVNIVSASRCKAKLNRHYGFETFNKQDLHCDGTLQQIGMVKTSIILCIYPANNGGDTMIFNSVGAFVELAQQDAKAALALLHPECLRRTDVDQTNNSYIAPAFTFENGELLSRYSVDNTSDWKRGLRKVKHLDRAYKYLSDMAQLGSFFYIQTKLNARQGIIIANDKMSHGRTAYIDSDVKPRRIIRGLFLNRPI